METFTLLSFGSAAMCLAYFFAGIIDASSGGGGLIILPVSLSVGFPTKFLMGTNQSATLFGAFTALAKYAKEKKIHWFSAWVTVPFAMIGASLGAKLNLFISEQTLKTIIIALIPVIAIITLINKNFGAENHIDELSRRRLVFNGVLIGLFMGAYQGFYGAGAGTFFMLAFAIADKLDLVTAAGNTKLCGLSANISATITYALSGAVMWKLVFVAMFFNIAGNYIGASLSIKNGAKFIRPMYFAVLILLFARLVFGLF